MLEKKGLCKVLKSTYPRGYEYIPEGQITTINGRSWAVQCYAYNIPVTASAQIVENIGYIPTEAILVQKGEGNQIIMQEASKIRMDFFKSATGEMLSMKKIPVIYRERWQLYQTERGDVFGFDIEIMSIIDFKSYEPTTYMADNGRMGMWAAGGDVVFIAPARFSWQDNEKIHHIAELDWENQQEYADPVDNMSMFDDSAVDVLETVEG